MTTPELAPGLRKISLDEAFRLAGQHHAAGRRAEAEALARQIVDANPRHAFAWQLLSVLAHEAGDAARAVELMTRAIHSNPMVAQFYANRAEMNRLQGNTTQAIADGQQALRLDPRSAVAHGNLGIAHYHQGDLDAAEACQKKALELDPGYLPALNNLGSIARDRRDLKTAKSLYEKALALRPGFIESANNLGAVLIEMDDAEAGLRLLVEVVRQQPNYAEAHCNIGNGFLALENFGKAELAFGNALKIKADYPEALEGLARCAQEQRDLAAAEGHIRRSLALADRAAAHSHLGSIQSEQGYPDKAAESYARALTLNPGHVSAWLGQGHLLMEMGKMDDAEACFLKALELDPESLTPRLSLTQVRKTRAGDANLAALEAAAADIPSMSANRALSLHFALGKAYEDLKDYDRAFPHFLEGCRLKRQQIQYDADNNSLIAENICATFTPELLQRLGGAGSPDATPIFVLGMPRSGTTLTETIIASHPDVYGAGELPDLLHIAARAGGKDEPGYPLNVATLTGDELRRMGEQYVEQVRRRSTDSRHITDKMPANFLAVGLIHLMLPNARIVHVRRNPVDTCVSGFTKLFNRSQHHSYDLRELGRYYKDYLRVMAHWRAVLPPGSFYELQYEQLVANQEEESRKLIAYCGLQWNDACLDPHKAERTVKTASVTQVRQPVYTSSVERWRVYEKFLGPLLEELKEVMPGS